MTLSTEFLLADVGGTGTRLTTAGASAAAPVGEYINSQHQSFAEIVADFCAHAGRTPTHIAVAAAGPVRDGKVHMTNLSWTLAVAELRAEFGFEQVILVNDFAALAWVTVALTDSDIRPLNPAAVAAAGNRVVLGPGTGLGVAALVDAGTAGWRAVTGEGGHVTLAVRNAEEFGVATEVAERFGHCSAERVLSGPGLTALAVSLGYGEVAPERVNEWARAGDPRGVHVVRVFVELLATLAADLALTFEATGGVFLAGGILPKLESAFPAAVFMQRFLDKGRMRKQLVNVPVAMIVCGHPALRGLERMLESQGY